MTPAHYVNETSGWHTQAGCMVRYWADAEVAQLVEQRTENPCVASSSLALGTILFVAV